MPDQTIDIRPMDGYVSAAEVREVLASRVRLKVREERRWFFWTVFHVTGPQRTLDEVKTEIAELEEEAWWHRQV